MHNQKTTVYICDFCGRRSLTRPTIKRHEKICFMNPDRTPLPGELLHRWSLIKHDGIPQWWPMKDGKPRFGCIYDGLYWVDVPGYVSEDVEQYHPYDEYCAMFIADQWPEFDGIPLNQVPIKSRLWKLQIHEYGTYPI